MTAPARTLREACEDAGAVLSARLGRDAVASFRDAAREATALEEGAGVVPLLGLATHEASGADARSFLHRMLTQDVASLADGDARLSLFLDVRGRVQGDPLVVARGASFLLVEEPAAAARAIPALSRYVVADDVAIADASERWSHLLVAGSGAPGLLAKVAASLAAAGASSARVDLRTRPAFRVVVPDTSAAAVVRALAAAGATLAGEEALDRARVETLWPWAGVELDDRVIANELALDAAISWTKGCYLGQEPVVMARHRGHPPTSLARVAIEDIGLPARDDPLLLGERPAGRVTTAVLARDGRAVDALAFVRHEHARAGTALRLADGRAVRVTQVAGA